MNYEHWCYDIFGKEPNSDPVMVGLLDETYALSKDVMLDYIDRALIDPDIHTLFTKEQIGIGLQIIYSNSCSNIPFCYIQARDEYRRIKAIKNLRFLYLNFFEKYCFAPVNRVGYNLDDGAIGYLCYMLWDIFVLFPGNASKSMIYAAVGVMRSAMNSTNDNCIVSAIHGLGHWASDVPAAVEALKAWLRSPSTENKAVHQYAEHAKTGCIQ